MSDPAYTWQEVAAMLRGKPRGSTVTVSKGAILAPEACGFRQATGLRTAAAPAKTEDWRIRLSGGGCLHVQAEADDWVAHRDVTDPRESLLGHALDDVPALTVAGAAVAGLALGGGPAALLAGGAAALLAWGRSSLREQDEFHGFLSAPPVPVAEPQPEAPAVPAPVAVEEPGASAPEPAEEGVVAEVVDIEEARRARAAQPADTAG